MKIEIVKGKKSGNIFLVYAPLVGRPEAEKEAFWGMLDDVTTVAESEVLFVAGNLNDHIGEDRWGIEEVMGARGFGVRNQERERILELCQSWAESDKYKV